MNIIEFRNPLKKDVNFLEEIEGNLYIGEQELKELTEEQKKISKTNANYYFTNEDNGNTFFCHVDKNNKMYYLAETVNKDSHEVWLKDNKSLSYYEGNIVLREHDIHRTTAYQSPEKMAQLISEEYESLKIPKVFVEYKDLLRENETNYIRQEGANLFNGSDQLFPMTEKQKKRSKTNANYYFENKENGNTFFCHLDHDNKTFFIAETINKDAHNVWLKDMKSVAFYEELYQDYAVLRDYKNDTSETFQNKKVMNQLIEKQYSELKSNHAKNNDTVENSLSSDNTIEKSESKSINNNKPDNKEGFFEGLGKDLRYNSESGGSLMVAFGIKDAILEGKGFKKNKFLKAGAAAGAIAVVASNPALLAGVVAASAFVTLGAVFKAALTTAIYTSDFVENKVKGILDKSSDALAKAQDPEVKSFNEVKSAISKIRSDKIDKPGNKHTL